MKGITIVLACILLGFVSCKKDCVVTIEACKETIPINESCQAYFVSWFYDKASNTCEEKAYSGCSQKGFVTEQECVACLCNQ